MYNGKKINNLKDYITKVNASPYLPNTLLILDFKNQVYNGSTIDLTNGYISIIEIYLRDQFGNKVGTEEFKVTKSYIYIDEYSTASVDCVDYEFKYNCNIYRDYFEHEAILYLYFKTNNNNTIYVFNLKK